MHDAINTFIIFSNKASTKSLNTHLAISVKCIVQFLNALLQIKYKKALENVHFAVFFQDHIDNNRVAINLNMCLFSQ